MTVRAESIAMLQTGDEEEQSVKCERPDVDREIASF